MIDRVAEPGRVVRDREGPLRNLGLDGLKDDDIQVKCAAWSPNAREIDTRNNRDDAGPISCYYAAMAEQIDIGRGFAAVTNHFPGAILDLHGSTAIHLGEFCGGS